MLALSCTITWPGERRGVGHDHVVADQAIVRDVCLRHEEAIVAGAGDAATARRAAVNGDEFANAIATANLSLSFFAGKLQVLRRQTNRDKRIDVCFITDARATVDHTVRIDAHAVAEFNVVANSHVRADVATVANSRAGADDGRRMNLI